MRWLEGLYSSTPIRPFHTLTYQSQAPAAEFNVPDNNPLKMVSTHLCPYVVWDLNVCS